MMVWLSYSQVGMTVITAAVNEYLCATAGEHEPVWSPKFGQERHGEKGLRVIKFTLRFSEGAKSGSPQFSWDQD